MHIDELFPGPKAEILTTIRISATHSDTTGTPQWKDQSHGRQPLIRAEQDHHPVALPPKVSETSPKAALEKLHQKALAPNVGF